MLTIQYFLSPHPAEATPPLPPETGLNEFAGQRRRRRLRLYLVGSETDTQHTIDYLQAQGCIERIAWNPMAIPIPENGVVIRPDPGDVLRYLQRDSQFG